MRRIPIDGFVGATSTVRSINVGMERAINWMPSISSPGKPKANPWEEPTPAVQPFVKLPESPIRGLYAINGRAWGVGGSQFVEIFDNQSYSVLGSVSTSGISGGVGDSVSWACNGTAGNQLALSAGGELYVLDLVTGVFTHVTDPDFITPTYKIVFIDGYLVSLVALTRTFQLSALEDFLSYDGRDVYEISRTADNLVSMEASHGQLVLWGGQTADIWANVGSTNTPFQPATGGFIEVGSAAPYGTALIDNTPFWLGANAYGSGVVYRLNGYTPQRISDASVEFRLSKASRLDSAIAWTYQEDGHPFYLLYVPGLAGTDYDTTFCYDVSTSLWHERALWVPPLWRDQDFRSHVGRCHCFAFNPGVHLVGDRQSGGIYRMSTGLDEDEIYGTPS